MLAACYLQVDDEFWSIVCIVQSVMDMCLDYVFIDETAFWRATQSKQGRHMEFCVCAIPKRPGPEACMIKRAESYSPKHTFARPAQVKRQLLLHMLLRKPCDAAQGERWSEDGLRTEFQLRSRELHKQPEGLDPSNQRFLPFVRTTSSLKANPPFTTDLQEIHSLIYDLYHIETLLPSCRWMLCVPMLYST